MKTKAEPLRFTWREFSGSLGDLGLFIPLIVAMTIVCDLDIGIVLIMAGMMNIVTGYVFRQPIPVQPIIEVEGSRSFDRLFELFPVPSLFHYSLSLCRPRTRRWCHEFSCRFGNVSRSSRSAAVSGAQARGGYRGPADFDDHGAVS